MIFRSRERKEAVLQAKEAEEQAGGARPNLTRNQSFQERNKGRRKSVGKKKKKVPIKSKDKKDKKDKKGTKKKK